LWDGFFLYWAASGASRHNEVVEGERRKIRRFNAAAFSTLYAGQIAAASMAATNRKAPGGLRTSVGFDGERYYVGLTKGF
jgi:hypothetical protein